jgi:ATP-binding cassette subfamily F protein 3
MQLKNLSMSFNTQILFNNINLYIKEDEKIGVVGVNGAGKTTLFKIIKGLIKPDSGKIILKNNSRVEWLPQIIDDQTLQADITVLDYLLLGRPIEKLSNELQLMYEKVSEEKDKKRQNLIFNKIENIQKKLEYWNYYSAETTLLKIIDGMNISSELLDQNLRNLSGGQKSKISFAKLLYSTPELMLLDEPTNHLDKESKDYVINYLKNYKGNVFIISHDTEFLNQIITKTLFLDKRTKSFKLYDGNYDKFEKLNVEHEKSIHRQAEIQNREEDKLRTLINKYSGVSGKRKKMAQDRGRKLEKLLENKIELEPNMKQTKLSMSIGRESTEEPLKIENLYFKYNKNSKDYIINNLSFSIHKSERFLVVGANGVGKTTLLKLIMGILKSDAGNIKVGVKTDIGYYSQEQESLDNNKNILENFSDINISQKELRNVLGRFLFYADDVFKKVGILSPGEKSRVVLAKLSLQGSNLLILDEPTNHLDTQTQTIIAQTFKTFKGTMILVSHNTEFVNNLEIKRVLILPEGKISYYSKEIIEHFQILNEKTIK